MSVGAHASLAGPGDEAISSCMIQGMKSINSVSKLFSFNINDVCIKSSKFTSICAQIQYNTQIRINSCRLCITHVVHMYTSAMHR